MADTYTWKASQGLYTERTFDVDIDGVPVDLAGFVVQIEVFSSLGTTIMSASIGSGVTVLGPGRFRIEFFPEETAEAPAGNYRYTISYGASAEKLGKLLDGVFILFSGAS